MAGKGDTMLPSNYIRYADFVVYSPVDVLVHVMLSSVWVLSLKFTACTSSHNRVYCDTSCGVMLCMRSRIH
jgi:hypothetical protein